MKLRLKGNAIRLRLSKTDVENLAVRGFVEEQINFSKEISLSYRLAAKEDLQGLAVDYTENTITVYLPKDFTNEWSQNNNVISTSGLHSSDDGTEIFILIEKDFKCLDNTEEDQSDNFANPRLMKL